MPRDVAGVPHLVEWRKTLSFNTGKAYGSRVSSFFRLRDDVAAESVTANELFEYLDSQPAGSRKQVSAALDQFFAFLVEAGHLKRHPAYHLSRRYADRTRREEVRAALKRAGASTRAISALSWRDVAIDAFGGETRLPLHLDAAIRGELTELLFDRLRHSTVASLEQMLTEPLLDSIA